MQGLVVSLVTGTTSISAHTCLSACRWPGTVLLPGRVDVASSLVLKLCVAPGLWATSLRTSSSSQPSLRPSFLQFWPQDPACHGALTWPQGASKRVHPLKCPVGSCWNCQGSLWVGSRDPQCCTLTRGRQHQWSEDSSFYSRRKIKLRPFFFLPLLFGPSIPTLNKK